MEGSLTVLKCFLVVLDFVEFLVTPLGLTATIILLFWTRFTLLG